MSDVYQSVFMKALRREPVSRTPVWLMRQAGRYLPEYRETRKKAGDFLTLCKTPELACEVTLQPLQRFDLDAAILFSDILTIPDAMGLGLSFVEGEGPRFECPIRTSEQIARMEKPDVKEQLCYVTDAASLIRQKMPVDMPLIGFSGSPWTLACYMIEGGSSKSFTQVLKLMYQVPQAMHQLLKQLTETVIDYLNAQVEAGVNALMVFDTWGGILSTPCFQAFSCDYLRLIVQGVKTKHPHVPIILFTKGGGQWLTTLADTGCDALSIDVTCDLGRARKEVGARVALQGNLDPALLLTSPDCIRTHVAETLNAYGPGPGHIFNLGHGVTPDVPPEHVKIMVDAVHEYQMS